MKIIRNQVIVSIHSVNISEYIVILGKRRAQEYRTSAVIVHTLDLIII